MFAEASPPLSVICGSAMSAPAKLQTTSTTDTVQHAPPRVQPWEWFWQIDHSNQAHDSNTAHTRVTAVHHAPGSTAHDSSAEIRWRQPMFGEGEQVRRRDFTACTMHEPMVVIMDDWPGFMIQPAGAANNTNATEATASSSE